MFQAMPTDGADFGRMKACYGAAYTSARTGAKDAEVAEIAALGVERDIRRDGGSPAFCQAVDLLVLISQSADENRSVHLLTTIDNLGREFADFPLTRYVADAAGKIGLTVINEAQRLSRVEAAGALLTHLARSRCLDGMVPYLTKNLTQSVERSIAFVNSVATNLPATNTFQSLAARMLNATPCGLPAKAPKRAPIEHSASALNDEVIGGGF